MINTIFKQRSKHSFENLFIDDSKPNEFFIAQRDVINTLYCIRFVKDFTISFETYLESLNININQILYNWKICDPLLEKHWNQVEKKNFINNKSYMRLMLSWSRAELSLRNSKKLSNSII